MQTTDAAAGPGYRSQVRAWLAEHFPALTGDRPGEELASAKALSPCRRSSSVRRGPPGKSSGRLGR
jgi:hypothetical protein